VLSFSELFLENQFFQQQPQPQQPQQGMINNFVNNQKDKVTAAKKTAISMLPMAASLGGAAMSGIGALGGVTGLLSPGTAKLISGIGIGVGAAGRIAGVAKSVPGVANQAKQTYGNIRQQQIANRAGQQLQPIGQPR